MKFEQCRVAVLARDVKQQCDELIASRYCRSALASPWLCLLYFDGLPFLRKFAAWLRSLAARRFVDVPLSPCSVRIVALPLLVQRFLW